MNTSLMTPNEVAACLRVHRSMVYRLCSKPDGLRSYKVGSRIRFKSEEVEEYLERCMVQLPQRPADSNIVLFQYKPGMKVVSL